MDKLIKIIRYFSIGVLLGSFSFLLIVLFGGSMYVESKAVASLFVFSGLIGLVSMIFEIGRFNFPIRLGLHILITVLIVGLMMYFAGWWSLISGAHILVFVITFVLVYIVVWTMLYLTEVTNAKKKNSRNNC
ncbi:DUF3021 domain-containing protein [Companilactobacillus keshanensis]|uniref:DUF3021 domain-containing protein n=1 Tax=Companilactobacillus keshanensis TaxID=2486003 RepID=A0ABW4BWY3_9LACO|nr:DUF3021 domain-containing protein [Companilactobacillus keshanensis]